MKVLIWMKEKPANEDEDQRGLFDRFFIQEKGNIIQNFNRFTESKGLEMQAQKVDITGNTKADAHARRIVTVHLIGDMPPTTNSAELHAAFGFDPFLVPHLQYAIVLE